jgi:two-component system, cell cycle sensor histidine kinase and response regulator CckA
LAFSRQQSLQPRILNITDVLAELSHLLRRLIGENIELKVVHGRDLGLVKVDQGQLEQVIINLAVNARDAMIGGGTLTIRTANVAQATPVRRGHEVMPPGDYVQIEVRDTGVGIPRENLERIFEPFFSTKEVGSGTGLGLSTVYGIVKQSGGYVLVQSEPQHGTAFHIYLPRAEGVAEKHAPTVAPAALGGTETVLLVEDEDSVRQLVRDTLAAKGYQVVEAENGETGMAAAARHQGRIDLIITDVVMPGMGGRELVKQLAILRPETRVLYLSGYTEDSILSEGTIERGAAFLQKPFTLQNLSRKVREVLG